MGDTMFTKDHRKQTWEKCAELSKEAKLEAKPIIQALTLLSFSRILYISKKQVLEYCDT
jgi:hypothetical protein